LATAADGEAIIDVDGDGEVLPTWGAEQAASVPRTVQAEATNSRLLIEARMRL